MDYARDRRAAKRDRARLHTVLDELDGATVAIESRAWRPIALDDALRKLSTVDERLVRVIELTGSWSRGRFRPRGRTRRRRWNP